MEGCLCLLVDFLANRMRKQRVALRHQKDYTEKSCDPPNSLHKVVCLQAMSTTTMHFGPEWMRTKHNSSSKLPTTSSQVDVSNHASLSGAQPEKQDDANPYRYSKEEMFKGTLPATVPSRNWSVDTMALRVAFSPF